MKIVNGIPVWGDPILSDALSQVQTVAKTAYKVALMADHHVGYSMPIGGVAAYLEHVSPSGVGYDIACGNKAVLTDMPGRELRRKIHKIMDDVWDKISFGIGRKNKEEVDHELFDSVLWNTNLLSQKKEMAQGQLGTVGSGNHYVDLFVDEQDRVWIGVHFGSRGLGHHIASYFLKMSGAPDGMHTEATLLHQSSDLGADYLQFMELAGRYAYAGRDWVCGKVARILGAKILDEVHNHHNFAWRETHGGQDLWVVRKGATPAFPGQKGFIGGSMGDISVIVEGVDHPDSEHSLFSTVHGAGRVLSRTQAAGKRKGNKRLGGQITPHMMERWVEDAGVTLRGAGTDESPHCYKRLPDVLAQHEGTIRILHTLTPVGVAMAGANEFDPYKD
ncbi:MAG: RtcB family protein [Armatimonadetes bacterium]|nr:RtcB family protein [Armatimonadota bacterium]